MITDKPRGLSDVDRARAKIATLEHRCSEDCPGWAVFNIDESEPSVHSCDECWLYIPPTEHPDPLTDVEVELLPEAVNELARAKKLGAAYDDSRPQRLSTPCVCGCDTWRRVDSLEIRCCACGLGAYKERPPAPDLGRDNHLFVKVLATMDEAENIDGPEGDDYRKLMKAIEDEARARRLAYDK